MRKTTDTPTPGEGAPGPGPGARRVAVIRGGSTAEIPVHLLFRDDTVPTPVVPQPGQKPGQKPGPKPVAPAARRAARPLPPPSRPAPPGDPDLVEGAGPVVPGAVAVVAGLAALAGCAALVWSAGLLPAALTRALRLPPSAHGGGHAAMDPAHWALLVLGAAFAAVCFGGLGRGRVGSAWVLSLCGDYRGSVRRTGLVWMNPMLLRRRVDVRLRHWRSEPMPAVDADGTALLAVVLVVWRVKDTARAALAVEDHVVYLRDQVEAATARVLSRLPADAFHEDAPTLRDAEAVGDALTRLLKAEAEPVGIEVYAAQPVRIEYAPGVAAAMRRRRVAALDARHRDAVLGSVVDAVDDTVARLTSRGLVELDDYERRVLVKDLTVAFCTGGGAALDG
ncbi:SPFH domain-containing protein [Streptomyces sp. NPDC051597]|uniref:SPFH domain-containing protein n=1 Tax=Streptomyces sp. NPDC051597 TaxID=3155049 RepID=UPI00342AF9D9